MTKDFLIDFNVEFSHALGLEKPVYIGCSMGGHLAADLALDKGKPLHETLSEREFQVLCMIAAGKSVTEIGDELALSVKTIGTYHVLRLSS